MVSIISILPAKLANACGFSIVSGRLNSSRAFSRVVVKCVKTVLNSSELFNLCTAFSNVIPLRSEAYYPEVYLTDRSERSFVVVLFAEADPYMSLT